MIRKILLISTLTTSTVFASCAQLSFLNPILEPLGLAEEEEDIFSDPLVLAALAIALSGNNSSGVSREEVVANYASLAYSSYSDAVTAAETFQTAVTTFTAIASPTNSDLATLQTAYQTARRTFLLTEAFRFANGPIDTASYTDGTEREGQLNAWPVDEDGVQAIVDNTDCAGSGLTQTCIVNDNGDDSNSEGDPEQDVTIGWHAIEFLLWGSDGTEGGDDYNSTAGTRAGSDFAASSGSNTTATVRRSLYLEVATRQIIDDLTAVRDAWDPNGSSSNYYNSVWAARSANENLNDIFTGLVSWTHSEFAGERMKGATSRSQNQDEHSCFSDLTKEDFYYGAQGTIDILSNTGLNQLASDQGATSELTSVRDFFDANASSWRYDSMISTSASGDEVTAYSNFTGTYRPAAFSAGLNLETMGENLGLSFTGQKF